MSRRRRPAEGKAAASSPLPLRIGGDARRHWLAAESWRRHGGKPGALARALLEEAIDTRMGIKADRQAGAAVGMHDPHADVRQAMLAVAQLGRDVAALASAAGVTRGDVARLAEAAEVIVAGVRGYVRHRFRALLVTPAAVPDDEPACDQG